MATSIEGFTQREIERAKRARKFYHDLNAESVENVKVFIRSNLARNVPVSSEDMDLANKVFGTDVPSCKGKWTKRRQEGYDRATAGVEPQRTQSRLSG